MDFDDTPAEAAFRATARTWLEANAPRRTAPAPLWRDADDTDHMDDVRAWQRRLFDEGWAGITWPAAHGGRGGSAVEQAIFNEEQADFDVTQGPLTVGLGMVGPTLIAHGTPQQQARFLPPLLRGAEVWCQLFSEPDAGSDLAAVATRARRADGRWVVDGQKVWTSGAQVSDWGLLVARTDPSVPKHAGLTCFLVDMRTPGVDVRPLHQATGTAHFNEVFLSDVAVPDDCVLGEVDGGWTVALTMLTSERSAIGGGRAGANWDAVVDLARAHGRTGDPVVRQRLAEVYTRFEVLRFLRLRAQTARSQGRPPGPEVSVLKLLVSRQASALGDLALELAGPAGMLDSDWAKQLLNQYSIRIGGGTDEVQRNVVGERVLGLPAEPRADRGVAFRDLARGRPAEGVTNRTQMVDSIN
ncbi:MAG: acyl-CoA dehydrogenase family protein [Actinobacteria bacterium]|nr:acyl-CoA dehydrogenase family protein [Actinomycetota bacterium]